MVMSETAKRRNGETAKKPIRHFRDSRNLDGAYEKIIGQLVRMIDQSQKWLIKNLRHHL